MTILTDKSSLWKLPVGKQSYDHCGGEGGFPLYKRQKVCVVRQYPRSFDSNAPQFSETRESIVRNERTVVPATCSGVSVSRELESKCSKNVSIELRKVLKNVEEKLGIELGNVKLENEEENSSQLKQTTVLVSPKIFSRTPPFGTKYPPPKIRFGISIVRDFPSGCGDTVDCGLSSNSQVVPLERSGVEDKPLVYGTNEICEDEHDCQLHNVQAQSGKFIADDGAKLDSTPSKCRHKQLQDGAAAKELDARISDSGIDEQRRGKRAPGCGDSVEKKKLMGAKGSKYCPVKQAKVKYWDPSSPKYNSLVRTYMSSSKDNSLVLGANAANPADATRRKVIETLDLFNIIYMKLTLEHKSKGQAANPVQIPIEAAKIVKQKMKWLTNERVLGVVPGVEIGDRFEFRAQLHMIGLHRQYTSGIDYINEGEKLLATSIVNSHRYNNGTTSVRHASVAEFFDVLFYSGQGGNPDVGYQKVEDQKLVRGNLALKNCISAGTPVRVIQKAQRFGASETSTSDNKRWVYVYDGLYIVSKCTQKRGEHGKLIFMFQLNRMAGQPRLVPAMVIKSKALSVLDNDISQCKEEMPIPALNARDFCLDYLSK